MAQTVNETLTENDYVPPELWGRDHYSTLAYIHHQLVNGGYSVRFDHRMRQNRRHFRVLGETACVGVAMEPKYGTRLSDGTYLPWHDDWCCVQDMLAAGLFEGGLNDWGVGFKLRLTEKGHTAAAALLKFLADGGNLSQAGATVLAAIR